MNIPNWMKLSLSPDFVIGEPEAPYLLRWWILPRNFFFNIYIHKIIRDDDDRALHDHMYHNCSIVLRGSYREVTIEKSELRHWRVRKRIFSLNKKLQSAHGLPKVVHIRGSGSCIVRRPDEPHRLEVVRGPVWTLFITGPRVRQWGFHTADGWKHWKEMTDPGNPGRKLR